MSKPNSLLRGLAAIGVVTLTDEKETGASEAPGSPQRPHVGPPIPPPVYTSAPSGHVTRYQPVAPPVDPALTAYVAELDKTSQDRLIHVMANDGAPRVEELMDTLETLAEAIPDERSRYTAALKLMGKKGSAVSAVLADYDTCLRVLDEHYRQFEGETQGAIQRKVGSRQQAVESLTRQMGEKEAQIAALQREIQELGVKRDAEQAAIAAESQKIELAKSRFDGVYANIRSGVQTQREKIAAYGVGL